MRETAGHEHRTLFREKNKEKLTSLPLACRSKLGGNGFDETVEVVLPTFAHNFPNTRKEKSPSGKGQSTGDSRLIFISFHSFFLLSSVVMSDVKVVVVGSGETKP